MPIYAYRCGACGHAKDVLQKLSDAPLTVCPACGAESFSKQVTAAGFQLKGSGWYVTDFRGGSGGASAPAAPAAAPAAGGEAAPASGGTAAASSESSSGTSASSGTACGGSCACH
ncbi:FmdB family zinc ribbon protein [Roseateles sp. 22389]|jgi:putative FmdB family regulatory protein|uniref:FmdB family zinc ribbon protein n=1 Tax=Roseateles sp. 22389 TaxID=3453916 RepID=UPI00262CA25D|nr:FmdB family zinc ribbon protein [uncultured Roseateles sp.]